MKKLSDNKNLIYIDKSKMSEAEWVADRQRGIGGSEAATVLGMSPWTSAIELFYQKVEGIPGSFENESMFWGKRNEDTVAEVWSYYEKGNTDFMKMNENFRLGKVQRTSKKISSIIVNPKYPNLFVNIDRLIDDEKDGDGVLEIKCKNDYVLKKFEAGLPPYDLIQTQHYMGVLELEYAELAILINGNKMDIFPMKYNDEIFQGMVIKCNAFWDNVLKARELLKQGKPFEELEPPPDDTEAYEKFMKERYVSKPIKIEGTLEILNTAKEMLKLNDDKKKIETIYQGHRNKIVSFMREADTIDFGGAGTITYKTNAKGSKVLNNYVKILD